MRQYLTELSKRPDHHKRHFALLASGTVTLFIFGIWSMTTFGIDTKDVPGGGAVAVSTEEAAEISPFQSFNMSLAASLKALKNNFGELKSGFKAVDFEAEYQEMRDGALNIYGR